MPTLMMTPPLPGAERRFQPFVDFVKTCGWEVEFVAINWNGPQPSFGRRDVIDQVGPQTAGKIVMGFSLGALYSHLGALEAKHLILGSISPLFAEDDDEPMRWDISYREGNATIPADILVGGTEDAQMHRRSEAVRDFYDQSTYTVVPEAEHELWHPNYLAAIGECLQRLR
jgi:hypothetical protein